MADDPERPLPPWAVSSPRIPTTKEGVGDALSFGSLVSSSVTRRDEPDLDDDTDLLALVGDLQGSRYHPEEVVGQGGMGTIEAVRDRPLERRIVRKRIHPRLERDPLQARMFVREARITGQLQHPSIVPVHELGVGEDRHLYYTMDLVNGRTLEAWIASLPPGPLERSTLFDLLDAVVRVCEALAYAHHAGVLHCDIKPANVMVGDYGRVYLMDWGIARLLEEEQRKRDASLSDVSGTVTHMAPEQARGQPLDVRSDVFAMGALLYHVLARRPPFEGRSQVEMLMNAYLGAYTPIDEVPEARGTPPALSRIVSKAMAVSPDDRHASVDALRDALVTFMRGVDVFPRMRFAPGEDVVREGELGREAYVIESGRCEVHRTLDGQRASIRVMGPGELFGEMAILAPGARTATVTAVEATVLLRITAEALEAEVDSMKPWMGVLVRTLAERFRERDAG